MGFDLSALDAELAQLGQVPEDPLRLAHEFAGSVGTLAEVDERLSTLAQQSGVPEAGYVERPARGPAVIKSIPELPAIEMSAKAESVAPRKRTSIPPPPVESVPPEPNFALDAAPESPALSEPPHALHAGGQHDEGIAHLEDSQWPTAMTGQPMFTMPPVAEGEEVQATPSWRPEADAREAVPLTQSQEIVLPDPVSREELSHESGELSLDTEAPSSGSYSLPDAQPNSGSNEFADMVDDDVQDALEGSQPLSLGAPARTLRSPDMDRDPDAEFDALLSEATDPRGMPVVSSELDTDALLRGLEGDEFEDAEEAHLSEMDEVEHDTHEADALVKDIFDEPESDNTEILDRASAMAIEALADNEGPTDEVALDAELDSGELEIMLDEEAQPAASSPPAKPLASKGPPPPPGDKRPSILGRFFGGKRDGE